MDIRLQVRRADPNAVGHISIVEPPALRGVAERG